MKTQLFKIIVFLFLGFFIAFQSKSQVYKFSKDPKEFQNDVATFFKDIQIDKTKEIVASFLELLKTDAFTTEEFLRIHATASYMLEKKHYKPMPQFQQYFEILVAYKKNNIALERFVEWDKSLKPVMDGSTNEFKDYCETILGLFTKNAIYTAESKTWYLNTLDYEIGYNNGQSFIRPKGAINLICRTREDTLSIFSTTGTFYPKTNTWIGLNGKVDWRRVYLDTALVYANIRYYKINCTQSEFTADSVIFYNKFYFSKELIGRLREKALTTSLAEKAQFPYFRSYKAVYILDKLSKNVLYIGGFTQQGRQMLGTSSMEEYGPVKKAKIIISYKGVQTFKAESDNFQITPEQIVSSSAAITIYYDKDSFFHPKMIFNYVVADRKVTLTRGNEGIYQSPMTDSYHKIEMEYDQMVWLIDNPTMDFRLFLGSEGSALFNSQDFFTMNKYLRTQGILDFHPLDKLKSLAVRFDTNVITIEQYARAVGSQPEYCEPIMIRLTAAGFIIYDPKAGTILIKEKTFLYANAGNELCDYDMLRFESTIKRANAVFSLNSGNLNLEGVGLVLLSDTHRVHISPRDQKITLKRNRDFEFSGYIRAGLFEFFGSKFYFDYNNFKINLSNIDSVRIYVRIDPNNPAKLAKIQSVLQNVSGFLYIDNPRNKSGRINYAEYPIFECTKPSYVFYDKPQTLGGNYDRDRFYFKITPFKVDSIDKFTMEGLMFNGTFVSGGIMPIFDYYLVPQKDLSLGFTKIDTFQLYVKEGSGKGGVGDLTVSLSNSGLRGRGTIEYLTSLTTSEDFIFYLDSMRSYSQTFNIEHNARGIYPKVTGKDVFTRWLPYSDTMIIEKLQNPFLVFEKQMEFDGNLVLTPTQLTSKGTFNYKNSKITSDLFVFKPTQLLSGDATVKIMSEIKDLDAFYAPHITMKLDIETDIMNGQSNSFAHKIQFPIDKYLTSMQKFTWYNLEDRIDLEKSDNQSEASCFFMSTHHEQDSLQFSSTKAVYNVKTYLLNPQKVPYIPVADAFVYPPKGEVEIEKDAYMRSITDAVVKADTVMFYHRIYGALINIFGKYKMSGYGKYDYVDKYKKVQIINFTTIKVDENRKTFGQGAIPDSPYFYLNPQFKFKGNASMTSTIKPLDFEGYVIPDHNNKELRTGWFRFNNYIDPDTVRFYLSHPKGPEERELFTGIYVGSDSPYVYNIFMGYRKATADLQVFSVQEGVLFYDDIKKLYVYGDPKKIFDKQFRGSYYTYDTTTKNIYGEGLIDFGSDIKAIEVKTAGNVNYISQYNRFNFEVMMTIDFPFDEKAINLMTDVVQEQSFSKSDLKEEKLFTQKVISELITDDKELLSILNQMTEKHTVEPTKSLTKTFVFTDLKMTFDVNTRFFKSYEDKLGLLFIKKNPIRKRIVGAVQVSRKRSGTQLEFYIEPDKDIWYFFKYLYSNFSVLSSDADKFNPQVLSTVNKYAEAKYRIKLATKRDLDVFKKAVKLY